MSPLLLLALATTPAPAETTIAYTHLAGERATYEIHGKLPENNSELTGTLTIRTVSVAKDGSADLELQETGLALKRNGQTMRLPEAGVFTARMDRQGTLLAELTGGAITRFVVPMFSVPSEPLTLGREIEWNAGGLSPSETASHAKAVLREVKDGKATIAHTVTSKNAKGDAGMAGEKIEIVTTHDLGSGRLTEGELVTGDSAREVRITLKLKSVTRNGGK